MKNFWLLFIGTIIFLAIIGCADKPGEKNNIRTILIDHSGCTVLNYGQYCASVNNTDLEIYSDAVNFYTLPRTPDFVLTHNGDGVSDGIVSFTYSDIGAPTGKLFLTIGVN